MDIKQKKVDMPKENQSELTELVKGIDEKLIKIVPENTIKWSRKWWIGNVTKAFKYFAIPSVILASILPVTNLYKTAIDSINRGHVEDVYFNYAKELMDGNRVSDAVKIIEEYESAKHLNINAQFAKAQALAMIAIKKGEHLNAARDSINILTRLHSNAPFFFPENIGGDNVRFLEILLVDIDLELKGSVTNANSY